MSMHFAYSKHAVDVYSVFKNVSLFSRSLYAFLVQAVAHRPPSEWHRQRWEAS